MFEEPFDAYLYYLLTISSSLNDNFNDEVEFGVKDLPKNTLGSASRWTLWVIINHLF